ncbi:hypothetical protein JCGZ_15255 [Jatropha curcas]|uniref:Uncharacterized protein n=1 Tax=Jatropha curcas TaxID=180498 RepID=A0A067K2U8_JATCU|nr:hypothetical protein JCGZ_15255 [Jatropha curcas]
MTVASPCLDRSWRSLISTKELRHLFSKTHGKDNETKIKVSIGNGYWPVQTEIDIDRGLIILSKGMDEIFDHFKGEDIKDDDVLVFGVGHERKTLNVDVEYHELM